MEEIIEDWEALADPEFEPLPAWLEALIEGQSCTDWVRANWQQAAAVPGAWYDEAKADAIIALWPKLFKFTVFEYAGNPFFLDWWQEIIVRMMVGWKRPTDRADPATGIITKRWVRIFRELTLWVPRKNGKTEFMAALALLFWMLDAPRGGEGYSFARDADQAGITLSRMKEMIKSLPTKDAGQFQVFAGSIYCPAIGASFRVISGAVEGKHGKGAFVRVGDEMHEWRSRKLEDDLRQGTGSYSQPIGLRASTAGRNSSATGLEFWNEAKAIIDGTAPNPSVLAVIFAASQEDDWQDETVWAKANPSLFKGLTIDSLRDEFAKAKLNRRAEAVFRCYHLNHWVDEIDSWINISAWDKCAPDKSAWKTRRAAMEGRRCWGGYDLSTSTDICSLVWLFEPLEGETAWQVIQQSWIPEAALAQRDTLQREQIQRMVDAGALSLIPGSVIDQDVIADAVLSGFADFDVQGVGFDGWQADKLHQDLQKLGLDPELIVKVRMGIHSLGKPSLFFENLVYAGLFDHGGDPLLRWMARNVVARFDENLNPMPAKKRSGEKIDAIMASVIALALSMQEKEESIYETRGLLVI